MENAVNKGRFSREQLAIIGAFAIVYIVWGSTYLFNYLAIQTIPPFLMSGSRFFTAGVLLFSYAYWRNRQWPSPLHWRNAFFLGILFLAVGTGGVVWAEQYVATGIASLVVALEPLVVIFMMWGILHKRPAFKSLVGVGLGILGMVILVGQTEFTANTNTLIGIGAILISILSWGYASVAMPKYEMPKSRLQSTAIQMIAGGLSLLLFSFITGEYRSFSFETLTAQSVWSWVYLIIFGSIIAFSCFNFLLLKVSPDKVATTNYVNPVVALWMGWMFNNEILSNQSLLAAGILLIGVFLIITKLKK